jgi:hypothetical protein
LHQLVPDWWSQSIYFALACGRAVVNRRGIAVSELSNATDAAVPKSAGGPRWFFYSLIRASITGAIGTAALLAAHGCRRGWESARVLVTDKPAGEVFFAVLSFLGMMILAATECLPRRAKHRPD